MPDKWGRITGDDWMRFADGIGQIRAMGQRNAQARQQQEDLRKKQQFEADVENNVYALDAGPQPAAHGDGDIYDAPGAPQPVRLTGSLMSQIQARDTHARHQQTKQILKAIEDKEAVLGKVDQLWSQFRSLPEDQRDDFLDNYVPPTKLDFDAFVKFGTALETNAKFKNARRQRKTDEARERFKQWSEALQAGAGFLRNGDNVLAEQYIQHAINEAHHPLFIQKNKDNTYDLIYEEGGHKSLMGDNITLEQAYEKAFSIPAKDFIADFVAQNEMLVQKNREVGFQTWRKGEEGYDVTVIYKPSNPRAGLDLVYMQGGGLATKKNGNPITLDDLKEWGFRPGDFAGQQALQGPGRTAGQNAGTGPGNGGENPPVEGAMKAEDGFWYTQRPDGGWLRIHTGMGGHSPERIAAEVSRIHGDRGIVEGAPIPDGSGNRPVVSRASQAAVLPDDVTQWDVTRINQGGRRIPVVILDNGQRIPITPEQYEQWRQATGPRTSVAGRFIESHRPVSRPNKNYRPEINPFIRQ